MPSILENWQNNSFVNIPAEVRGDNVVSSLSRNLPCVTYGQPNTQKVAVVAGGPSLIDDLEEIRKFDGYIVAINGAHDLLVEKGIIPDAVVCVDASDSMSKFFKKPQKETTYLICSSCAPSVFDALEGYNIILWHAGTVPEKKGLVAVCTGPSAATSAPYLLFMIGYRDIHLFGVDSSFLSEKSVHAYSQDNKKEPTTNAVVGLDVYLTSPTYALQAIHFWNLYKLFEKDIKMTIHGYGLTKAIFDNNGKFEII